MKKIKQINSLMLIKVFEFFGNIWEFGKLNIYELYQLKKKYYF